MSHTVIHIDIISFDIPRDFSLPSSSSVEETCKSHLVGEYESGPPTFQLADRRRKPRNVRLFPATRVPWEVTRSVEEPRKIRSDLKFASLLDQNRVPWDRWLQEVSSEPMSSMFIERIFQGFGCPKLDDALTLELFSASLFRAAGSVQLLDRTFDLGAVWALENAAVAAVKAKARYLWLQLRHDAGAYTDAILLLSEAARTPAVGVRFLPELHNFSVLFGIRTTVFIAQYPGDVLVPRIHSIDVGCADSLARLFVGYAVDEGEVTLLLADPCGADPPPPVPFFPEPPEAFCPFLTVQYPSVAVPRGVEVVPTGAPIVRPGGAYEPLDKQGKVLCPEGLFPVVIDARGRDCGELSFERFYDGPNPNLQIPTLFRARRYVPLEMVNWADTIKAGEDDFNHAADSSHGPLILVLDQISDIETVFSLDPPADSAQMQCALDRLGGLEITDLDSGTQLSGTFKIADLLFCVHTVSPLNQIDQRPLFTLRGLDWFAARRVYLHSPTAVFVVVAETGTRPAVLVVGGRPGDQALDDMYVCARIPGAAYVDSAVSIPRDHVSQSPLGGSRLGVVVETAGEKECHVFQIRAGADPCARLEASVVSIPATGGREVKISSPVNPDPGRGFVLSVVTGPKSTEFIGAVLWATDANKPEWDPNKRVIDSNPDWLKQHALRSQLDIDDVLEFASAGEVRGQTLGFEVDGSLFLLVKNARDGHDRFYSPAPRNAVLRANVFSLYNRFYRHSPDFLPGEDGSRLLIAVVDIGSVDSMRRSFLAGTAPALYWRYVRQDPDSPKIEEFGDRPDLDTAPELFRYAGDDGDVRTFPTFWLYFNNGSLPVGLSYHRTLCQLFAAFSCAAVIRVHGPGMLIRDFRLSSPLFSRESFVDARARLVATYGTLLRIGRKHFAYAAKLLPTTQQNIDPFKDFLKQLDAGWDDESAARFLMERDIDARFKIDPPK